jgi:hypothetical protein
MRTPPEPKETFGPLIPADLTSLQKMLLRCSYDLPKNQQWVLTVTPIEEVKAFVKRSHDAQVAKQCTHSS